MTIEAQLETTNNLLGQLLVAVKAAGIATAATPQPAAKTPKTEPQTGDKQAPAAPKAEPAPAGKPAAPEYDKDVKPKVLAVSTKLGRDKCTEMLSRFGLKTAKDALPEQFSDIIAACEEALK